MTTTLEKLYDIYPATASIIPYKDWVIIASIGYKGTEVEIYETADSFEEFENFERRFDRIYQEAGTFEDFGHAVKWAFEKIGDNMDAKMFNNLKTTYPVGTKVRLVRMDDPHPVPKGTLGTVIGVDDIGSLLVKWENGSCLNVLYGIDIVEKVK